MDVAFLIKEYFKGVESNLSIDVFDAFSLKTNRYRGGVQRTFPGVRWIEYIMVEFRFAKFGGNFGTTEMGAKIRQELLVLLKGDERIVLDFTGVNVVTNSFADECIAKLLLDMPLGELKKKTTFRGLNPVAEKSVLVALQRRYKVLNSPQ